MANIRRRRWAFLDGLRRTLRLFVRSKIGMIGAVIIAFFCILAIFAPILGQYEPVFGTGVGADFSVPTWATIFPQYQGYAPTGYLVGPSTFASSSDCSFWTLAGVANGDVARGFSTAVPPPSRRQDTYLGTMQINASIIPVNGAINTSAPLPGGQVFFSISKSFEWNSKAPKEFKVAMYFSPVEMKNLTKIYINYIVSSPRANHSLSTTKTYVLDTAIDFAASRTGRWLWSNVTSDLLGASGLPGFLTGQVTRVTFETRGTYTFTVQVQGVPKAGSTGASVSLLIAHIRFFEEGNTFGLLGTDNNGRDVWSQLVWGSQISLLIGILSGVGSVLLGTLAGIAAGYLGGISDEAISRVTDFFLVLPFLPLLIVMTVIITQNSSLAKDMYYWVVVIFIVLSWPSIAKIIRSQVLTVKERQYVEASRAVGGGTAHVLRKHILPNVMGLVYSQIALNVSGFILLEAALDFLSVSIRPVSVTTWGVMLTKALPYATVDALHQYVWWWFLPPGIAIASLSLAFVLVGFALDSIFNPRLRAR